MKQSFRQVGDRNPWTAEPLATITTVVAVVALGILIGKLCRMVGSMWPAYVLFVPALLFSFWVNQRLHKDRR